MGCTGWRVVVAAVAVVWAVAGVACGKIIYVDDDANSPGDGTSWTTAYKYLQDGLADARAAGEVVEVRVAQGVYRPDRNAAEPNGTGDRLASCELVSGVALVGGYAGWGTGDPNARERRLYETILSGDLGGNDIDVNDPCDLWREPSRSENAYHVVTASGTDPDTLLEGFMITGGNAYEYEWHPLAANTHNRGGGLRNEAGSLRVRDCTFLRNVAEGDGGGAMSNRDGAAPYVLRCEFTENVARSGGAVYTRDSKAMFEDCLISRNRGPWGTAAMVNHGSVVDCRKCSFRRNTGGADYVERSEGSVLECEFIENSDPFRGSLLAGWRSGITVEDCAFVGNRSGRGGAAIFADSPRDLVVSGCSFVANTATNGGAVLLSASPFHMWEAGTLPVSLRNCLFNGNTATDGGAIYALASNVSLASCTFSRNRGERGDAVLSLRAHFELAGRTEIANCILWDEGDSEIASLDDSPVSLDYSNVYGGRNAVYDPCGVVVWGVGNMDADPLFADPNNGDFHLRSRAGRWYPNSESWVTDSVTSPCIDAGDPLTPIGDEPFPNGGRVNMGAYGGTAEASKTCFGGPPCEIIVAGDVNGDCRVDFQDFQILALHWLEDRR